MSEDATYLVLGAAGALGRLIVPELLKQGQAPRVRVGVRGGAGGKHASLLKDWATRGIEVLDADLDDAESLERACDGADTVISAVQGGPDVIIAGQARLLAVLKRSGATRFVPSDFAEDLFSIPEGINPYLDWRRTFDRQVAPSGIGFTHFLNGGFMDAVFSSPGLIDAEAGTIGFWGDGHMPMDFTSMQDVAAYLAAALADPNTLNSTVEVAGDSRTVHEVADDYEAVTGRRLQRICHGSIEAGYAELRRMEAAGAHPMAMLPMQYLLPMMSGEGRLRRLCNARYPSIKPTSLRDFLRSRVADTTRKAH